MLCANDHKVEAIFMLKARLEITICLMETIFGDPMVLWNKVLLWERESETHINK